MIVAMLLLATSLLSSGCNLAALQHPVPPTAPSTTPQPTFTQTPTATRTPGPPVAVLILPADIDPKLAEQARAVLGELTQSSGMLFQTTEDLVPTDLPLDLALLILLRSPPSADLAAITSRAPNARIVAPAGEGLFPGGNLTLFQPPPDAELQQAFLAGFTAALITEDYRVAIMIGDSDDQAIAVAAAFRSGAEYYCGLCRPQRPPFEIYPLSFTNPPEDGPPSSLLSGTGVQTVFVPATLFDSLTLNALAASGLALLGTIPPPAGATQRWAASFRPSPVAAIESAWPELTSTSPPDIVTSPIIAQDINDTLLSPGRQRLVTQTQTDISLGLIDVSGAP